jgi:hypothetical protein
MCKKTEDHEKFSGIMHTFTSGTRFELYLSGNFAEIQIQLEAFEVVKQEKPTALIPES